MAIENQHRIPLWMLSLSLLFSCVTPGSGAEDFQQTEFRGAGLCRFATHGFKLNPGTEKAINDSIYKLLERHRAVFGFAPRADFHVRLRIFGKYEDYTNATFRVYWTNAADQRALRGRPFTVAGFYTSGTKEMVTWQQNVPGFLGITLLHEASHAIMDAHFEDVPLWILEGSADYFAFALHGPSEMNQRHLRQRWAQLNAWIRDDELLPLKTLLNADSHEFKALEPERAYTMSWSLFQLVMSSDANRRMLNTLLQERQRSEAPLDSSTQMDRLYPGGLEKFEATWRRWVIQYASSTNAAARSTSPVDPKTKTAR